MPDFTINNWFTGEVVDPDDMKIVNNSLLEVLFGYTGGNAICVGCLPTITSSTLFSVSSGAIYFGQTNDATYISNTGTNKVFALIPAQTNIALVSSNCYIYIKEIKTPSGDNRTTAVTAQIYSSTTTVVGDFLLATVDSGALSVVNSINPLGASTLQAGVSKYCSNAEAIAGTVNNKIVPPTALQSKFNDVFVTRTAQPNIFGYKVNNTTAGKTSQIAYTNIYKTANNNLYLDNLIEISNGTYVTSSQHIDDNGMVSYLAAEKSGVGKAWCETGVDTRGNLYWNGVASNGTKIGVHEAYKTNDGRMLSGFYSNDSNDTTRGSGVQTIDGQRPEAFWGAGATASSPSSIATLGDIIVTNLSLSGVDQTHWQGTATLTGYVAIGLSYPSATYAQVSSTLLGTDTINISVLSNTPVNREAVSISWRKA